VLASANTNMLSTRVPVRLGGKYSLGISRFDNSLRLASMADHLSLIVPGIGSSL